jgi:hypothetical protein
MKKQMNKVEKQSEILRGNIRKIPLFKSVVIDEIADRIKQSCDESTRINNVVKIGELIKISPLLNKYGDENKR